MKGNLLKLLLFATLFFSPFASDGAVGKLVAGGMIVKEGEEWNTLLDAPLASLEVRARLLPQKKRSGGDSVSWNVTFKDAVDMPVARLSLVSPAEGLMEDILPADPTVGITLYDDNGNISLNERLQLLQETRLSVEAYLSLSLSIDGRGRAEVMAGDERLATLCDFQPNRDIRSVSVGGGDCSVEIWSVNLRQRAENAGRTWMRSDASSDLSEGLFISSSDQRVGVYEYLDSDTDTELCRPGGRYSLGVVPDGDGGYEIIYLAGAEENGASWLPGMVKGRLTPTIFRDHFNLEWVDAEMSDDMEELWCLFDGMIMELHFPKERGVMRFSRSSPGH